MEPAELARHAAERGVDVVAVTDHDTVGGVASAASVGAQVGVEVVAGIELSTRHDGRELHVLGYFVDTGNDRLRSAIERMRKQRLQRARAIVDLLQELGYSITMADIEAQAGGDVIARPHIARALVAHGYVGSVRGAFTEEFIGDGGRAFVAREALTSAESIELIRSAGGVAVLAHPGVSHHEGETSVLEDRIVSELAQAGLAGLEVDHPDHPPLIRDRLRVIADEYGLVTTGGSDWHGLPEHTLGGWTTSEESFRRLRALATAGG